MRTVEKTMSLQVLGAVTSLLAAMSCGGSGEVPVATCRLEVRAAIAVYVQDFVTRQYVASGATLYIQDGAFRDSASFPANRADLDSRALSTAGSVNRPGSYLIRVHRPPYADFVLSPVIVGTDGCNVIPRVLTIPLNKPLGG